MRTSLKLIASGALLLSAACLSRAPEGIAEAKPAKTTVKVDLFHRPLPEIPLPNDLATRHDPTSATGRRVNASMIAPTQFERRVRTKIDELDGWGSFQPITIPFTGPLSIQSILDAHRDPNYGLADDVVYLINVDRDSESFGKVHHLDIGNGNYPVLVEQREKYWKNDPRAYNNSILFEETNEDLNGNGILDAAVLDEDGNVLVPPEDTDADGLLDTPNYLPGANPDPNDLAARADALMYFYEKQTNTLIVRPLEPLDERTTYAIVVTRRLLDEDGEPVGSPYKYVNHTASTEQLVPLKDALKKNEDKLGGLSLDDVAFTFPFTTQSTQSAWIAVRDGLYGHGVQKHLAEEFPPVLATLEDMRDPAKFPGITNTKIVYVEQWMPVFEKIMTDMLGADADTEEFEAARAGFEYIDYLVVGSYESPQLFERKDADGNWLPFDEQSWPQDLYRVPAKARSEKVYFTMTVPRKEVSARGEGKQVPVVLQGHGYSSNRFEGLQLAAFFAKLGVATIAIDAPSHGLGLSDIEISLAQSFFRPAGILPAFDALGKDRAINWDNDPRAIKDSGADYWTAYLFHTRDVVRQYALDWMQAVRILRTFDGKTTWDFETTAEGKPRLAGDFDGDGVVDLGKDSKLSMVGGSLGGLISQLVGSIEPEIDAIAPIAGGGGFGDMGIRTVQGGAVEGFILRAMAPLYVGTAPANGVMRVETIVPNMNKTGTYALADVSGIRAWDAVVVENLENDERGCGYVRVINEGQNNEQWVFRAAVESDKGDRTRILFYDGPKLVTGDKHCAVQEGAEPKYVLDTFELAGFYQYDENGDPNAWEPGDTLVALADGYGLPRGHPDLRRFQGLGQLVLDSADPATFARHLLKEPLTYPGTGHTTGAHAMVVTTLGDMAVPASTGVTYGRAAGLIDYLNDDPRYGVPPNQVLLDTYVAEAVHTHKRYTDPEDNGVHLDVENFSEGLDMWGATIPRLDPPIRLGLNGEKDALGGVSAAIFPFPEPKGAHGFNFPGVERDDIRKANGCTYKTCDAAAPPTNPCSCDAPAPFDTGTYLFNMLGHYLGSGGKEVVLDHCMADNSCGFIPAPPARRSGAEIDAP